MQPHSISAVAVMNYVFYFYGMKIPKSATVELSFPGAKLVHTISGIEVIGKLPYIDGLKVPVRTKNGELCTLTIKRKSSGSFKPDEEYVVATHSIQHVAGLEEHYRLSRHHIYGRLFNTQKYGPEFGADVVFEGQFALYFDEKDKETHRLIPRECKVKFVPTSFQIPEMAEQKQPIEPKAQLKKLQEEENEEIAQTPTRNSDRKKHQNGVPEAKSADNESEKKEEKPDSWWKLFVRQVIK